MLVTSTLIIAYIFLSTICSAIYLTGGDKSASYAQIRINDRVIMIQTPLNDEEQEEWQQQQEQQTQQIQELQQLQQSEDQDQTEQEQQLTDSGLPEYDIDFKSVEGGSIGTITFREDVDIRSGELISGRPGFGFAIWSNAPRNFLSASVNWDRPILMPPPASDGRDSMRADALLFDPLSSNERPPRPILYPAVSRILFYIRDNPAASFVGVAEYFDQRTHAYDVEHNILTLKRTRLRNLTKLVHPGVLAGWKFPREWRQVVRHVGVLEAPRGNNGITHDDFRCGAIAQTVLPLMPIEEEVWLRKPLMHLNTLVYGLWCYPGARLFS